MPANLTYYNKTVDYLYELQRHGIKLGLQNSERLMALLENPRQSFHSIHIAGTNGKGSTAAIIASILKESGFKVGLFTSPHLVSFTERIMINSHPISETDVIGLTSYLRKKIAMTDIKPTFFEFVTAMAFYYFACNEVDWAVVEAGMGGRFDATNVIMPAVSVITNIGFDHKEFLGESISDIAFEKAGIIKHSIPVITAATLPEALEVIERAAKNHGSEIHLYEKDFKSALISMDDRNMVFDYRSKKTTDYKEYKNLSLPLSGEHQLQNVSLAIRLCQILIQRGFLINNNDIYNGLLKLNVNGRLEWVSRRPPIIIDSAHNPDAAKALATAVKKIFYGQKKIILIIGIMNDKDIEGILNPLIQISDVLILTKPKGDRAASPEKLKLSIKNLTQCNSQNIKECLISTTNTVAEAIELGKKFCSQDHVIIVTGSFYTTGEVKEILGEPGVLSNLRE